MAAEQKHAGPENTRFSWIDHVRETGSTNRDLLLVAERGESEGAALITDHQTAGRGRAGRAWLDEPGRAMLASWLLRPDPAGAGVIPLLTGLAVRRAVHSVAGVDVGLKWPNDVVIPAYDERKLAGILAEASTSASHGFAVVTGCGLNLSFGANPPEGDGVHAIDLASITRSDVETPSPVDMLTKVLAALEPLLAAHERGDSAWLDEYRQACVTLGRSVTMDTPAGSLAGIAESIDVSGGLQLRLADGTRQLVTAGDVHHVRRVSASD